MPRLIQDADFNRKLRLNNSNVIEAKHFLKNGTAEYIVPYLHLPEGYRLLKSLKNHKGKNGEVQIKIRLLFGEQIVYAVNLNVYEGIVKHQSCTQVLVWRTFDDAHEIPLLGFARKMFAHFMDKYIVVISDDEQTQQGRGFWEKRISNALQNGHNVYFTDMNDLDADLVNHIHPVETLDDFYIRWVDHGWGKREEYKDRLFIISGRELEIGKKVKR